MTRTISMGIIGVGWIGGLRARTCAAHPLVESLHLCEIDRDRLQEMARETGARSATTDFRELLARRSKRDRGFAIGMFERRQGGRRRHDARIPRAIDRLELLLLQTRRAERSPV